MAASEFLKENRREDIFFNRQNKDHYMNHMFHGFDMDRTMLRIGAMNMMTHGVDNPFIEYRDSLSDQNPDREKYSLVLANHPFAITRLPNGRWQTYYQDPLKKKKIEIKLATREKVIDRLVTLYKEEKHHENITLNRLYEEWIAYKETITESKNTIVRHKQHYWKYFQDTAFFKRPLKIVDRLSLQSFANGIVKDNNLSSKEWTNVKTILKGMFEYALEKEMIQTNPMDRMKITVKFRQIQRKTGSEETFNADERALLEDYLKSRYQEKKDQAILAIRLNFYLGLRVGELVALKASDIVDGKYLHIVREESRDYETNTYTVVEHTKTHRDRFIPLVPKAIELMDEILVVSSGQEYLFAREGCRITSRQINYVLEKFASKAGLDPKRSHKIRKTVASTLNANGLPVDAIRVLLGHSNLQTTMAYLYNPLTNEETYGRMACAL